jgi:ubiquinone/menaquinone biosynthesis C-methylase UbiE
VTSGYDPSVFDEYEASGWEDVASAYDDYWSAITAQAIDPLLDAAAVGAGTRLVDVGTGCGDAAGRAAERGAEAVGVDVAAAMVAIASRRHPTVTFVRASAVELPFAEGAFDAAVGNIVIQHIGEPERAATELARVLAPNGRVALSTWEMPERSPFFAAILGAISDAAVPAPSDIPGGPAFFQFADEAAFRALLADAGFQDVDVGSVSFDVPLTSAEALVEALERGTVRTGALLRAADDGQRRAVRESLASRLEPWQRGERLAVPASFSIASGRKPE